MKDEQEQNHEQQHNQELGKRWRAGECAAASTSGGGTSACALKHGSNQTTLMRTKIHST